MKGGRPFSNGGSPYFFSIPLAFTNGWGRLSLFIEPLGGML